MEVSIVIPVWNRAEMVMPTLNSVVSQTHRPLHLVLVDNNSTDTTFGVLNDFKQKNEAADLKIDVITESTAGACAARNAGMALVQSEWVMFFDSDDTMDACLVAKYVEKIESCNGEVDIVTTNVDFTDGMGVKGAFFASHHYMENHIFHALLSTQRYIVRKSLCEKAGAWNNDVKCWNDWELGIRLLLQSPRLDSVTDGVYVHIKVHDDSITGARYSDNHERRENALNVALEAVENSDYKDKKRVMRLLKARRFVLAGLYKKEGRNDLAQQYYEASLADVKDDCVLRLLAPIVCGYVGMGGRGVDRLIRFVVRN